MLQTKEIENGRPCPIKIRARGEVDQRLAKLVKSHSLRDIKQVRKRGTRNLKVLQNLGLLPKEECVILQQIIQARVPSDIDVALNEWEKLDNPTDLGSEFYEEAKTTTQALSEGAVVVIIVVFAALVVAAVAGYIFYNAMSDAADGIGGGIEDEEGGDEEGGEEGGDDE